MYIENLEKDFPRNHEDPELAESNRIQQIAFTNLIMGELRKMLLGLEALTDQQAADYLTAHPKLLTGVPYLPNEITLELVQEARGHI